MSVLPKLTNFNHHQQHLAGGKANQTVGKNDRSQTSHQLVRPNQARLSTSKHIQIRLAFISTYEAGALEASPPTQKNGASNTVAVTCSKRGKQQVCHGLPLPVLSHSSTGQNEQQVPFEAGWPVGRISPPKQQPEVSECQEKNTNCENKFDILDKS